MVRGLPYSIGIHVILLILVMFYGNAVQREPIRTPHSIRVQVVELPQPQTTVPKEIPIDPLPMPKPEVKKETIPDLPVKELPTPKEQPEKKPEEKPREKVTQPEAQVEESPPADIVDDTTAQDAEPMISGPSVQGTDVDFPFAWYLARVQGQIARNWNPKQLGFRSQSVVSCKVHFTINKNGTVSQITLTQPSGVGDFDREALRVVQSSRIPPLPSGFASSTLGVSMKFNLESGI